MFCANKGHRSRKAQVCCCTLGGSVGLPERKRLWLTLMREGA